MSSSSNAASKSPSSAIEVPSPSWEGYEGWKVAINKPPSPNEAAIQVAYRMAYAEEWKADSRARYAAYCATKYGIGKPLDHSLWLLDVCLVFYEKSKMFRLVSFRTLGMQREDFGDAVLEPVFTRPGTWEEFSAVPIMEGRSDNDFLKYYVNTVKTRRLDGEEFRLFGRFEAGVKSNQVFKICHRANLNFRIYIKDYYGDVMKTLKYLAATTPKITRRSDCDKIPEWQWQ